MANLLEVIREYEAGNVYVLDDVFELKTEEYHNKIYNTKDFIYTYKYKIKEIDRMYYQLRAMFKVVDINEFNGYFHGFLTEFIYNKTMNSTLLETEDNRKLYGSLDELSDKLLKKLQEKKKSKNVVVTDYDLNKELSNILFKNMKWKFATIVEHRFGKVIKEKMNDEDSNSYETTRTELKFASGSYEYEDQYGNVDEIGWYEPSMQIYQNLGQLTDFQQFLESIDIEKFLNDEQKRVYQWMVVKDGEKDFGNFQRKEFNPHQLLSYDDIVYELNKEDEITGRSKEKNYQPFTRKILSNRMAKIRGIIINKFIEFKNELAYKNNVPTSQKIREFLEQYKLMRSVTDNPKILFTQYFGFLKSNYTYEEEILNKHTFTKPQHDSKDSIFDIVSDYMVADSINDVVGIELNKRYYEILLGLLKGTMTLDSVSSQDMKRIVERSIKIFQQWIKNNDKKIEKIMLGAKFTYSNKKNDKIKKYKDFARNTEVVTNFINEEDALRLGLDRDTLLDNYKGKHAII